MAKAMVQRNQTVTESADNNIMSNEVSPINLNGEFITHKAFGRGQIISLDNDLLTVEFCETKVLKKFIFPSALETFLVLESDEMTKQFKQFAKNLALKDAEERQSADDRLLLEKNAVLEHKKALKKAAKKAPKKTKVPKEPKEPKEAKKTKEAKEPKEPKEAKETKSVPEV